MDAPTGPYLIAACLCEKVLVEQDGVHSLVRIVDRITHREAGPNATEEMPSIHYPLHLFISLKPGGTLGSYQIIVRMMKPDGSTQPIGQIPVAFHGGEDQGASLVVVLQAEYTLQGLYWFEIYWEQIQEGNLLTKVPLRLLYLRAGGVASQSSDPPKS